MKNILKTMKTAIEKEYTDVHILVIKNLLKDFEIMKFKSHRKAFLLVPSNGVS